MPGPSLIHRLLSACHVLTAWSCTWARPCRTRGSTSI